MGGIVLIVFIAIVATFAESMVGKIVLSAALLAIGLLLLRWITGIVFLVTLAKACAVIMVVVIVGALLLALIN